MLFKSLNIYVRVFILILSFFVSNLVFAENPGVIDTSATNQAKVCHDSTCTSFGIINFELTNDTVVVDSDNGLSGQVWGNDLGWVTLDPTNGGVTFANTSTGVLTGKAWSQVSGWINFAPTGQGVTINPDTGEFAGYAWSGGAYGGWIKFDCGDSSTCVKTTWRASSGGGGGSGSNCTKNCNGPVVCPPGWFLLGGQCVHEDPPYDYCPNINLVQTFIPNGMYIDNNGNCVNIITDSGGGGSTGPDSTDPVDPTNPTDPIDPIDPINPADPINPIDSVDPTGGDDGGGGFLTEVIEDVQITLLDLIDKISTFIKTPEGSFITKLISTLGLITGLVATLSGIFSLTDIGLNFLRLWSFFLYGMGFKKRNRPWGVVYDSITKQPLDPVYVVLKDTQGNEIGSSITDLDGRYGFLVTPGIYSIVASKTNYTYPSVKLAGYTSDELYNDLYFGETIEIKEEGDIIAKNIPLDRLNFDWNEFAKKEQKRMKFYHTRDVLIARFSDFMFFLGFIVSVIVLFVAPKPYNVIIFTLYILLLLIRRTTIRKNRKGQVSFNNDNVPLSYGILRVKSSSSGQEVAHRVLDKFGNYYCLVPNGFYTVSFEKKNDDSSYSLIYTIQNIQVKNGILKKDFKI